MACSTQGVATKGGQSLGRCNIPRWQNTGSGSLSHFLLVNGRLAATDWQGEAWSLHGLLGSQPAGRGGYGRRHQGLPCPPPVTHAGISNPLCAGAGGSCLAPPAETLQMAMLPMLPEGDAFLLLPTTLILAREIHCAVHAPEGLNGAPHPPRHRLRRGTIFP